MQNIATNHGTATNADIQFSYTSMISAMKSIANGIRNIRARLPQRTASNAHDVYTVLVQGLTVLRIAALVLVLYIRFKLEHLVDRRRD